MIDYTSKQIVFTDISVLVEQAKATVTAQSYRDRVVLTAVQYSARLKG